MSTIPKKAAPESPEEFKLAFADPAHLRVLEFAASIARARDAALGPAIEDVSRRRAVLTVATTDPLACDLLRQLELRLEESGRTPEADEARRLLGLARAHRAAKVAAATDAKQREATEREAALRARAAPKEKQPPMPPPMAEVLLRIDGGLFKLAPLTHETAEMAADDLQILLRMLMKLSGFKYRSMQATYCELEATQRLARLREFGLLLKAD